MAIASNFPAIKPSLLLDFANTKKLDPRITFTRTTTATYYDGITTAMAEQNLLLYSQEFDNPEWVATNTVVSANTGDTTAPDGTSTADKLTDNTTSGTHRIITLTSLPLVASTVYACSVFVKAGTHNFVQLTLRDGGTAQRYITIVADLSTQTISQTAAGSSATLTSSAITSVGNSWYRIQMIGSLAAVGTNQLQVAFAPAASGNTIGTFGTISYIGTGTSFYAWGAQVEQRSSVTAYTATTTQAITNYIPVLLTAASGVPRFDHNPTTDESLGLLIEQQRTNLVTYSAEFDNAAWTKSGLTITANTIVAPDGTLTGDKIVENTTLANHYVSQAPTLADNTVYTVSTFVKAAERVQARVQARTKAGTFISCYYDIVAGTVGSQTGSITSPFIVNCGNGWFRIGFSYDSLSGASSTVVYFYASVSTNTNYTGDGYSGIFIWGAQVEVEAGAVPTSYIATTSATVTRNADAASMTGTNFTSWYNAGQGTLYADINPMALAAPNGVVINDNTTSNRIRLATTSVSDQGTVTVSGTAQATLDGGTPAANTNMKLAMTYQANNFALSLNGATAVTDTSGTVPVVSQLQIGSETTTVGNLQIKKIAYYPIASTATQLQALTS